MYSNNKKIIDRKNIFIGEVVKDAEYHRGGIFANLMCDFSEIQKFPYYDYGKISIQKTSILRGIIYILDSNNKTLDIANTNDSYDYPIVNVTENLLKEVKNSSGLSIRSFYNADGLLDFLNFNELLTLNDITKFKQIISKEKELIKLASACGYRQIDTFFTSSLDYKQETKIGNKYYKFTGRKIAEDDRCKYKNQEIFFNPIKNFRIFELLSSNLPYGYEISEYEKTLKLNND